MEIVPDSIPVGIKQDRCGKCLAQSLVPSLSSSSSVITKNGLKRWLPWGRGSVPLGTCGIICRFFWLSYGGMGGDTGCYRHLVGRGQGSCRTSYRVQKSSPHQRISQPQVSTVWRQSRLGLEQWLPRLWFY